ncbi:MAG: chorismate-binding protein, partial [Tolypothrix sp. T3-bin4]|nr:chorismate-binding protein [Tolypothrix sp. T3-bin4]
MTVTSFCANLFQDHKQLYQILSVGKQQSIAKDCPQIVSISQEMQRLEPLAVLQAIAKPNQLQFYWENRKKQEAIAAIDAAVSLQVEGRDRFSKAQQFIQHCLKNTISNGILNLPFSGSHFFCSFTFFENNLTVDTPFPSATVFLPRWQVSLQNDTCVLVANVEINSKVNLNLLVESLCTEFKTINWSEHRLTHLDETKLAQLIKQNSNNTEWFKQAVSFALKSIQTNQFSKIVLANAIDVLSPQPFNLINSLKNLRKRHPDCYIFSTSNGKGQNFMGASPERLISVHNKQLVTDALAGSAPRGKTRGEDAVFAHQLLISAKERREHQFVLDFITKRLAQLGLAPQLLPTPQLLQLSNIQHLWTPIQALVPVDVHPLDIVAKLHPTPAVAGVPTD